MFSHLHVHDTYSVLDGLASPEQLAQKAKELGFSALGISNHGNIDSFVKFEQACSSQGITPIFGCEMYFDKNRRETGNEAKRFHGCLFVKNEVGFCNLQKLISIANLEGFARKPRIDPVSFLENCEGLVLTTACLASFIKTSWGKQMASDFLKKNPGDLYFEIMPIPLEEQRIFNLEVIETAKKMSCKIIASNDVHYVESEDSHLQEILLAVNSRAKWDDPKRFKFQCRTHYLCSEKEMIRFFRKNHPEIPREVVEESLRNTQEIVDKCKGFRFVQKEVVLPLIPQCKDKDENSFLKNLIAKGLREKISQGKIDKKKLDQYRARIEEELSLLIEKHFVRYFLIVWELIDWCRKNNIMVGPGRGSVGGCLIAYLIDITIVDPIKYDLLFSRFISPDRNDLPDIDMDFEDRYRHLVIEHAQNLYGKNNVAGISTFLSLQGRSAIQDVCRVFDIPKEKVNSITKTLDEKEIETKSFTQSQDPQVRQFYEEYSELIEDAIKLQGVVRGYGQHAAGICISSNDLRDGTKCNLVKRKTEIVCNWDKVDAEYMGLIKMDFLGLSALTRIHECLDLIKEETGEVIDIYDLQFDDPEVYRSIRSGDTTGIFQLGTYGISKLCKEIKASCFQDLYNITALYRPGPLGSGMTEEFVKRKKGKSYKDLHEIIGVITKDTQGIVLYQEQVMFVCNQLAGLSWGKCDKIRKLMAKSKGAEALKPFEQEFLEGSKKKGLSDASAKTLWNELCEFGKYGFNKSHSVEYSMISYYDAWLKHYYPLQFFASFLTFSGEEKKKELINKILDRGYTVQIPKIGFSAATKWKTGKGSLLMPFSEIVGFGESKAIQVEKASKSKRKGFFGKAEMGIPKSADSILNQIHAYEPNYEFGYKELQEIQHLFPYDLQNLFFES